MISSNNVLSAYINPVQTFEDFQFICNDNIIWINVIYTAQRAVLSTKSDAGSIGIQHYS